jgi:hypothetical protein
MIFPRVVTAYFKCVVSIGYSFPRDRKNLFLKLSWIFPHPFRLVAVGFQLNVG